MKQWALRPSCLAWQLLQSEAGLSPARPEAELAVDFVAPQVSVAALGARPRSDISAEAARLLFPSWERAQCLAWADLLARPDSREFAEMEAPPWSSVF